LELVTLDITSLPWPLRSSRDFAEPPALYLILTKVWIQRRGARRSKMRVWIPNQVRNDQEEEGRLPATSPRCWICRHTGALSEVGRRPARLPFGPGKGVGLDEAPWVGNPMRGPGAGADAAFVSRYGEFPATVALVATSIHTGRPFGGSGALATAAHRTGVPTA